MIVWNQMFNGVLMQGVKDEYTEISTTYIGPVVR